MTLRSSTMRSKTPYTYPHTNNRTVQNTQYELITLQRDPSRNRLTDELPFIGGCSHFTRKHTVSRPGFRANASPHVVPCNSHAAITIRFAASHGIPASIYAHGNKTSQQSCSHYTTICNHRFQNALHLRTHEQPHSTGHPVGTNHTNDPAATTSQTSCLSSAAAAALPENTVFRARASAPTQVPM